MPPLHASNRRPRRWFSFSCPPSLMPFNLFARPLFLAASLELGIQRYMMEAWCCGSLQLRRLKSRQRGPIRRLVDVPVRGIAAGRLRILHPMDGSFQSSSDARSAFPHGRRCRHRPERATDRVVAASVSVATTRKTPSGNHVITLLSLCIGVIKKKKPDRPR